MNPPFVEVIFYNPTPLPVDTVVAAVDRHAQVAAALVLVVHPGAAELNLEMDANGGGFNVAVVEEG